MSLMISLLFFFFYICFFFFCYIFFFFQAEDGIRDLVRSRGLGDVYKRQRQDIFLQKGVWGSIEGVIENKKFLFYTL